MTKSYVTLEQNQCPVCLDVFDTGSLLLDKRLRDTFEHHTLTGHSMCKDCASWIEQGYIHLIVASRAPTTEAGRVDWAGPTRTGEIMHMKRSLAERLFNLAIEDVMFIDEQTKDALDQLYREQTGEAPAVVGGDSCSSH